MPGKSYKWTTNLRESDSEEESTPPPFKRRPISTPQSLEDALLAEAEQLGEQEKDEKCVVGREVIDIAQIDEGDVKFVETPFSIAARLAEQRRRQRLLQEELTDAEVVPVGKAGRMSKVCRLRRSCYR